MAPNLRGGTERGRLSSLIFGGTECSAVLLIRSMKLLDWLKREKLPRYKFAEQIGVQPSVVTDYIKGLYCPRPHVAEKIIMATRGEVTANDFLSDAARQAAGAAE